MIAKIGKAALIAGPIISEVAKTPRNAGKMKPNFRTEQLRRSAGLIEGMRHGLPGNA
jgi:hypothetical protein